MNAPTASLGWKAALNPWAAVLSIIDSVRADLTEHSVTGRMDAPSQARRVDEAEGDRHPLWLIKLQMAKALQGCPDRARARIAGSIAHSHTGMELWLLRAGVFQSVSIVLGEREARGRINGLLPLFEGWVPEKNRTPV